MRADGEEGGERKKTSLWERGKKIFLDNNQ